MTDQELILHCEHTAMCWALNQMRGLKVASHKLKPFTTRILQIESTLKYIGELSDRENTNARTARRGNS